MDLNAPEVIIRNEKLKVIAGKATISLEKGDEVVIKTPSGGGYGTKSKDE